MHAVDRAGRLRPPHRLWAVPAPVLRPESPAQPGSGTWLIQKQRYNVGGIHHGGLWPCSEVGDRRVGAAGWMLLKRRWCILVGLFGRSDDIGGGQVPGPGV